MTKLAEDPVFIEVGRWSLLSANAIESVLKATPDARFVVCLKDPSEVAWALHRSSRFPKIATTETFRASWRRPVPAGARWEEDLQGVCRSGRSLLHLASLVPADRLLPIFFDDLLGDPASVLDQVQDFLEVRPVPASCLMTLGDRMRASRPVALCASFMRPFSRTPSTVRQLLGEVICEDAALLSAMTGRDLSAWIA